MLMIRLGCFDFSEPILLFMHELLSKKKYMVPRNLTCFTRLILLSSTVDVGVGGQTREIERHFGGP